MGKLDELIETLIHDEQTRYVAVCKGCHYNGNECPVECDITDKHCVRRKEAKVFIDDFKDFCAKYDII